MGNFADLICYCVEEESARGETFVVSDGQYLSTADLVRKISIALDRKPRIVSLNPGVLRMFGKVSGKQSMVKRLTESLEIDSTKVGRVLGWKPPYSMEEELGRVAEWYRQPSNMHSLLSKSLKQ